MIIFQSFDAKMQWKNEESQANKKLQKTKKEVLPVVAPTSFVQSVIGKIVKPPRIPEVKGAKGGEVKGGAKVSAMETKATETKAEQTIEYNTSIDMGALAGLGDVVADKGYIETLTKLFGQKISAGDSEFVAEYFKNPDNFTFGPTPVIEEAIGDFVKNTSVEADKATQKAREQEIVLAQSGVEENIPQSRKAVGGRVEVESIKSKVEITPVENVEGEEHQIPEFVIVKPVQVEIAHAVEAERTFTKPEVAIKTQKQKKFSIVNEIVSEPVGIGHAEGKIEFVANEEINKDIETERERLAEIVNSDKSVKSIELALAAIEKSEILERKGEMGLAFDTLESANRKIRKGIA